jgi:glycosyltransferase involved in cell wall biosynthesis
MIFPFTWYYEAGPLVRQAVRRAHKVFCAAPCLQPRIQRLYGTDVNAHFLPSPVDVPENDPIKSREPLALFVGRWDHRKRIERFFDLAAEFPRVRFVAVGRAHDARYDRRLRQRYGHLPNVEMPGFLSRFGNGGLYDLYAQAWMIVNTSAREGLPYTFVEALAFGCAVLSVQNPDEFAERFGFYVTDDNFVEGMDWLLADDRWRQRGAEGAKYVRSVFHTRRSIDLHLEQYRQLLGHKRSAA